MTGSHDMYQGSIVLLERKEAISEPQFLNLQNGVLKCHMVLLFALFRIDHQYLLSPRCGDILLTSVILLLPLLLGTAALPPLTLLGQFLLRF